MTPNHRTQPKFSARFVLTALAAVFLLAPLTLAFAQESNQPGETDEATAAQTLNIDVGEMYFQLEGQEKNAPITLKTGITYAIVFHNTGAVLHEIQLGRDPGTDENGQPHDYQTMLLDGFESSLEANGVETVTESLIEIQIEAGGTATLTFQLPDSTVGTWEIGCFQPGHYQAGMHAPVIVN
jgi:uncharacterized cupredoxin-like copper-binding protein